MMKKRGFTLAEVLITLGIIGVVAALTLPNLVANYKKQTYVTQLRKTVSTLEQGFQKMRADAGGVDSLEDTEIFAKMRSSAPNGACTASNIQSDNACIEFVNDLKSYFHVEILITDENYTPYFVGDYSHQWNTDDIYNGEKFLIFPDGAMIAVYMEPYNNDLGERVGFLMLDVNGYKNPNIYGVDSFYFNIAKTGKLYDGPAERCLNTPMGEGCYSYLARNGWKMDY